MASPDIPASWANIVLTEPWQEIAEEPHSVRSGWFQIDWKAIGFAVVFWVVCVSVYIAFVTR